MLAARAAAPAESVVSSPCFRRVATHDRDFLSAKYIATHGAPPAAVGMRRAADAAPALRMCERQGAARGRMRARQWMRAAAASVCASHPQAGRAACHA